MRLQDIADMKNYLEDRCYCPYEIYDVTGFFFQCFNPETECELLSEGERGAVHGKFVVAKASEDTKPQIIYVEITDNKVDSCTRFDATEHNKQEVIAFMHDEIEKMDIDEYEKGNTKKAIKEIMDIADAIMI